MANFLASGMAWLNSMMGEHCSEVVTYQCGASSFDWPATVGLPRYASDSIQVGSSDVEMLDFSGDVSLLAIGGNVITPRPGHQITRANGAIYRVEPVDGEQCYRTDATGQRIRVHAKRVG